MMPPFAFLGFTGFQSFFVTLFVYISVAISAEFFVMSLSRTVNTTVISIVIYLAESAIVSAENSNKDDRLQSDYGSVIRGHFNRVIHAGSRCDFVLVFIVLRKFLIEFTSISFSDFYSNSMYIAAV